MSSPASCLRKTKRSPLPEARRVPFRQATRDPLTPAEAGLGQARAAASSSLAPRGSGSLRDTRLSVVEGISSSPSPSGGSLRRETTPRGCKTSRGGGAVAMAPSDGQLLGSMAARLALVERDLLTAKGEIVQKDAMIRELERQLSTLARPAPVPPRQLEMRCSALQRQVEEMEEFLNDYGMVWVGTDGEQREVKGHDEGVWLPDSSVTHKPFAVDFDLLVKNIKALSVLAGEGSAAVSSTPRGARLKALDPVPLVLYANGIAMFQGPFRPFSDPHTQHCIEDLMEGYFPSELQSRYPDGVPFELNDQRDTTFVPRGSSQVFSGGGHKLGGSRGPSKLLPSPPDRPPARTTSQLPGAKLSAEQFLSRLPAAVVRGGKVLDIRSGVSATLQGGPSSAVSSVTLVDTPALEEIRSRLSSPEPLSSPSASASLTTLKVRSESGDQTFVLRMRSHDTIADVWSHLLRQTSFTSQTSAESSTNQTAPTRTGHSEPAAYQLVSSATRQVYSDPSATLQGCGLTPNATLHVCRTHTAAAGGPLR